MQRHIVFTSEHIPTHHIIHQANRSTRPIDQALIQSRAHRPLSKPAYPSRVPKLPVTRRAATTRSKQANKHDTHPTTPNLQNHTNHGLPHPHRAPQRSIRPPRNLLLRPNSRPPAEQTLIPDLATDAARRRARSQARGRFQGNVSFVLPCFINGGFSFDWEKRWDCLGWKEAGELRWMGVGREEHCSWMGMGIGMRGCGLREKSNADSCCLVGSLGSCWALSFPARGSTTTSLTSTRCRTSF